jgi:hypothetical protein
MNAKEVAQSLGWCPAPLYDNKERTPLPPFDLAKGRTRRISLADVSVFTGTPPTKPLVFEIMKGGLARAEQEWAKGGQRLTHRTGGRNHMTGYSATGLQNSC